MAKKCSLPINDPGQARGTYLPRPGVYSFHVATGEPGWFRAETPACDDRADWLKGCDSRFGHSVTPLLIDGVLITGTIDGRLLALDADSGDVLFEFDTVREYATVNGVQGIGGAIDAMASRRVLACCWLIPATVGWEVHLGMCCSLSARAE